MSEDYKSSEEGDLENGQRPERDLTREMDRDSCERQVYKEEPRFTDGAQK